MCNPVAMWPRWIPFFATLVALPAQAAEFRLCSALNDLKAQAVSVPQRITVYKQEAMTFACGRSENAEAQEAFCNAAAKSVGVEFTDNFPWLVHKCLERRHIKPGVEVADRYTGMKGRKKIIHLWARWGDGTRLDIRFHSTGDLSEKTEFRDYWGSYAMTIWRP